MGIKAVTSSSFPCCHCGFGARRHSRIETPGQGALQAGMASRDPLPHTTQKPTLPTLILPETLAESPIFLERRPPPAGAGTQAGA